jgi:hypothetical protein
MTDATLARLGLLNAMVEGARITKYAMPSTLYVRRPLLNGAEVARWAKGVGFPSTLPPADMHVTIAFSKRPVDWMKIGVGYPAEMLNLDVAAGGPRNLAVFGEGAVVLQFVSAALTWRHEDIIAAGASWDWPDYLPHVTITYGPGKVPVNETIPYQGELHFGPEIFEPVDEGWKDKVTEK